MEQIEHRLRLIAGTTTRKRLRVHVEIDDRRYPRGSASRIGAAPQLRADAPGSWLNHAIGREG